MKCTGCEMELLEAAEFHPLTACLLFKQVGNADKVRATLAYISGSHPLTYQIVDLASKQYSDPEPIDMILPCPACRMLHVDEPEPDVCECGHKHPNFSQCLGRVDSKSPELCPCEAFKVAWDNPPHKSHLCHGCGIIWRPADVPTNGVAEIKTKGENDTWSVHVQIEG